MAGGGDKILIRNTWLGKCNSKYFSIIQHLITVIINRVAGEERVSPLFSLMREVILFAQENPLFAENRVPTSVPAVVVVVVL